MFVFTDNKQIKKELKLFQVQNDYTVYGICKEMGIIPQTYYSLLRKQGLSFVDVKRICDAMDAELCIEIKKKTPSIKENEL